MRRTRVARRLASRTWPWGPVLGSSGAPRSPTPGARARTRRPARPRQPGGARRAAPASHAQPRASPPRATAITRARDPPGAPARRRAGLSRGLARRPLRRVRREVGYRPDVEPVRVSCGLVVAALLTLGCAGPCRDATCEAGRLVDALARRPDDATDRRAGDVDTHRESATRALKPARNHLGRAGRHYRAADAKQHHRQQQSAEGVSMAATESRSRHTQCTQQQRPTRAQTVEQNATGQGRGDVDQLPRAHHRAHLGVTHAQRLFNQFDQGRKAGGDQTKRKVDGPHAEQHQRAHGGSGGHRREA